MLKTFITFESQERDSAEMSLLLFKLVPPKNLALQMSQEGEEISGNSRKSPKSCEPAAPLGRRDKWVRAQARTRLESRAQVGLSGPRTGSRVSPSPDPCSRPARTGKPDDRSSLLYLLTLLLGAPGVLAPPPESRVTVEVERSIVQRR